MTQTRFVQLGDALELAYGKNLPKKIRAEGNVPVYGSNGIAGWHNTAHIRTPTVIVGRKGGAGVVHYVEQPCFPIDTAYFVRLRDNYALDMRFVYFLLKNLDLPRLATATGVPGLTREDAYRERILVPSLTEQHRIVDLLTRAEGIVRLRREAQEKSSELIPALFLEMFGDPARNPKGWPIIELVELLAEPPILGTMSKPTTEPAPWLDLRVANIQDGKLTLVDKKWLDLPEDQVERFALRHGDMLLARAIGSLDHLGKAVIVSPTCNWTFDSHLMRVRLNHDRLLPIVFKAFLESTGGRNEFLKYTRRSAVQFNVNGKELRKIRVPLPPIKLQHEFVTKAEAIHAIAAQQASASTTAQAAFDALLCRSFQH